MKELIDVITDEVKKAFVTTQFDASYAVVSLSNRPDLCEYQCSGALAAAKQYHRSPMEIAEVVSEQLKQSDLFESVETCKPGFINMKLSKTFLVSYVCQMYQDKEHLGLSVAFDSKTIMIDFGGPNVAKPLHVGHLRSAVIGESLKRISRFVGHHVIGDVHLGDWGLQMGLIIHELSLRKPDLCYFDETYTGEYPTESPFTISELEEIYPMASSISKENEEYKEAAMQATFQLQQGHRGYCALLNHIMKVSVTDLKRNYENLQVSFDLWKGESDAAPYIDDMVSMMKKDGFAYESEGAIVVDVQKETDSKPIPPCMILKSDGAALYNTTDLATLIWREEEYHPDQIIYVVDKRQELHFIQVFRCAKKTHLVPETMVLTFLGFGTMNGLDGKPFKTRDGGVMRLERLIADIDEKMLDKIKENETMSLEEAQKTSKQVALAAIKYGDLSNQPAKDYIFDLDRFTSFEGNTGPYILYTLVRMKSIFAKYEESGKKVEDAILLENDTASDKDLLLVLSRFHTAVWNAYDNLAPNILCSYIYELANALNHFYHETKILSEVNEDKKKSYIALLDITRVVLEKSIYLLGFDAPEKM